MTASISGVLIYLYVPIALAIVFRLLLYRKRYARHKIHMSLVAYGMAIGYWALAVTILLGRYPGTFDWPTLFVHTSVLFSVYGSRGNVSRLIGEYR